MNITSAQTPQGEDEFARADIEKSLSTTLKHVVPMVKASPIKFECTYHSTVRLPGNPPMGTVDIIIGRVVGVHISDEVTDGLVDLSKVKPIARCGYFEYAVVRETFEMKPPVGLNGIGLEGDAAGNGEERERRAKLKLQENEGKKL